MSLTSAVIRFAAPLPRIEQYERYLFIGPHPDDIEIGAGATAAKLADMGKTVCFLVCIDGRYGDGGTEKRGEELVKLRQEESRASAEKLGVHDVRFLPFCDGGFYDINDLQTAMAKVVGDFKPDVIFAPDPDVKSECHADHLNVGRAAKRLAYFCRYPSIMARCGAESCDAAALALYFTARPNRYVGIKGYLTRQSEALFGSHVSQFPDGKTAGEGRAIALYLKVRAVDMGLRSLRLGAEGFRVLGVTHMHCLPDADIM